MIRDLMSSEEVKATIRRTIAAIASEAATLELLAAKRLAERRGGVLRFPWREARKDHAV